MRDLKILGVIALLCVGLNACVTVPTMAISDQLAPQTYAGRFSVSYLKDDTPVREQGSFEWKIAAIQSSREPIVQPNRAMQLSLLGPLNATLALLAVDPNAPLTEQASLTTPGTTLRAPDLSTLMNRVLGWQLPLEAVLPWLSVNSPKAAPSPEWRMDVLSRHESGFPKVLLATHADKHMTVRLVFDDAAPVLEVPLNLPSESAPSLPDTSDPVIIHGETTAKPLDEQTDEPSDVPESLSSLNPAITIDLKPR
jgi:hypothetical protein